MGRALILVPAAQRVTWSALQGRRTARARAGGWPATKLGWLAAPP